MITIDYPRTMARYNAWQNRSLYAAAGSLTDAQRKTDRSAFFGSIHGTLCHLLFGDQAWMHRFTAGATPKPKASSVAESATAISDWAELQREREAFDVVIREWADGLDPAWLDGDLTWYSGILKRDVTRPRRLLVAHFFNHQTHHRGQAHALITHFGARPEDTDLPFMPPPFAAAPL
jgi:uncharacterized damage-inducible protein DinB